MSQFHIVARFRHVIDVDRFDNILLVTNCIEDKWKVDTNISM